MIDYRCLLSSCAALDGTSSRRMIKLLFKAAFRLFLFRATNPFESLNDEADLLLVSSHNRPDLLKDLDVWCAGTVKSICRVHIKVNESIGGYFPRLDQVSRARYMVSEAGRHLGFKLSALGWLFLFIRALEACKYSGQLRRNVVSKSAVVFSHMEMQFYENIVVQVARLQGCKTYAMQHGFYSDDGVKISASVVNPVNYLASVAHTFLAWGGGTIHEVKPYMNCDFVVVGKPACLVKGYSKITSTVRRGTLVVLDSKINQYLNQSLLDKVLNEAVDGQAIYVITHPDDDTSYRGDFYTVSHNEVTPVKVIGLNSSALIQYGVTGYRVQCHSSSRLFKGANSTVRGKASPNELILIDDIPQDYWQQYIKYTAAKSINKLDGLVG